MNDETAGLIQSALAESRKLRPYLRRKFPALAITDGRFEIHPRDVEFNRAAGTCARAPPTPPTTSSPGSSRKTGGYFDRAQEDHPPAPDATFGHAVHESMHKVSHAGFLWWDSSSTRA